MLSYPAVYTTTTAINIRIAIITIAAKPHFFISLRLLMLLKLCLLNFDAPSSLR